MKMKVYQFHPIAAAILFTILIMGVFGLVVVLPIAFITWTWNALVTNVSSLPQISIWQAGLLYVALGILLYLFGFVQVEVEANKLD